MSCELCSHSLVHLERATTVCNVSVNIWEVESGRPGDSAFAPGMLMRPVDSMSPKSILAVTRELRILNGRTSSRISDVQPFSSHGTYANY